MEIYLVRHTTPNVKKGICYGQTDIDINSYTFESELCEIKNKLPSDIDRFYCSPLMRCLKLAKKLAEKKSFDAIIALGAVIRGGTPHFDFVAGECNKGLAQVSLEYGVPVSFGVITTDSIEQAIERSGTKAGNKGAEAALGALEMVNVIDAVEKL